MPPNWSVGGKKRVYVDKRLDPNRCSDLAIRLGNGMFWNALVAAAGAASECAYIVSTVML